MFSLISIIYDKMEYLAEETPNSWVNLKKVLMKTNVKAWIPGGALTTDMSQRPRWEGRDAVRMFSVDVVSTLIVRSDLRDLTSASSFMFKNIIEVQLSPDVRQS